jgi:membrane-associated phospholipid phosphatase
MPWGIQPGPAGHAPRPLLRPRARRPAALALAGCAAVTAALAVAFARQSRADRLDAAVDGRIRGGLDRFPGLLHLLAGLGGLLPVTVLTAALVAACLVARWWRGAALAGLAVPAAVALTEYVLKPIVDRSINGYPSFPSGHATAMFALAATCAVLLASPPRLPGAVRLLLVAAAVAVAAAVPTAMVALGYHYFTDTVAGTAVGIGMVLLTALLIDRARPPGGAAPGPAAADAAAISTGRLP